MIKKTICQFLVAVAISVFSINMAVATTYCGTIDGKRIKVEAEASDWIDEKVYGCPGSWEACCDKCGSYLQNRNAISGGWNCKKDWLPTGIWLRGCELDGNTCTKKDVIDVSKDIDTSSRCYEIKEMTKGERVAVRNIAGMLNVQRWKRTGGEEQLFMVKPRRDGGYYFINKKYNEFLSVDRITGNTRLWEFVNDETLYFHIEWTGTKNQFQLKENTTGEFVTVDPTPIVGGNIRRWEKTEGQDQLFEFIPRDELDCSLPQIPVNVTGDANRLKGNVETPIRGFVDAHTHITSYEFMSGKMIHGKPFHDLGPLGALNGCGIGSTHGPSGALDIIGTLLGNGNHHKGTRGWPELGGWNDHRQMSHMGYYYKWIKRAYLSGQRLMVTDLVENEVLCGIQTEIQKHLNSTDRTPPNSCNTMDSIRLQARRLREMQDYIDTQAGGTGKGWFRLVTSPTQAREVIADGKLAVLMGVEASETFNCGLKDKKCDHDTVDAGLDELYELGVRTIFPAHKFDNQFSGSRVEGDFINLGQWLSTGRFFETKECDLKTKGKHFVSGLPFLGKIPFIKDILGLGSINPQYNDDETFEHCNVHGLSQLGVYLINRMIDKKMLIEMDHISVDGATAVMDIVKARKYSGVISSHSWMNSAKDGGLHKNAIRLIQAGGYIAPYNSNSTSLNSVISRHLDEVEKTSYLSGVGFGTDMSGLGDQPGPRNNASENPLVYPFESEFGFKFKKQVSGTRTFDLNKDGIVHYGLLADHLHDIIQPQTFEKCRKNPQLDKCRVYESIMNSAEAYLQMWERAEANTSNEHINLPIAVEKVAAQAGVTITEAALDKIWKATGIVADRPYKKQAFYVNTENAANKDGDCQILQDGDHICIYAKEKNEATAKNSLYITLKTQPNLWWKAVTAYNPNDMSKRNIVEIDNEPPKKVLVSYADMFNSFIMLSKAKELGQPREMYWIMNSYDLRPSYDWVIEWKKDSI